MKGLLRQGKGRTLVLQHGFLSGTSYWKGVVEVLSQNFDVIALDLPGYSDRADEPSVNSVAGFVEDLLGRLDQLKVDQFDLCGHSLGGMIAQELALTVPERVKNLILYATGPDGSMPGRFESIDESKARIKNEGSDATIRQTVASWFLAGQDDPTYLAALELAQKASEHAFLDGYQAMQTWQSMDRLKHIKARTLVLWPDRDRSYQWQHPKALWEGIDNAALAVIPGCAHNAHLEKLHLFTVLIEDFLDGSDVAIF